MATLNTTAPLTVHGHAPDTDAMSLYAAGGLSINSDATLSVHGHASVNTYASLHVTGATEINDNADLFVDGLGATNGVGLLYIVGSVNAVNTFAPLHLQVDNGSYNDANTLYLLNTQTEVAVTQGKTLYLEGSMWPSNASAPLFLMNEWIETSATLFVRAPGVLKNAVPFGRGAPLFINRPDESIAMTLFMKAVDTTTNTFATLHTISTVADTDSITLAIPNVASVPINSYATLATEGLVVTIDSIDLFTHGRGTFNGAASLFIKQGNQPLNTYATLFTTGVEGVPVDNITLAIPSVIDDSTLASIPFYIFGW
jgi:hypothetical protein